MVFFLAMAVPALIGHVVLWVTMWNFINGSSLNRLWVRWLSRLCFAMCGGLPFVVGCILASVPPPGNIAAIVYTAFCLTVTTVTLPWEYVRRLRARRGNRCRTVHSVIHSFPDEQLRVTHQARGIRKLLLSMPWNEAFDIEESERELEIAGLPPELDGFSIAHITDLHLTGEVSRDWFASAVEIVNRMEADVVAVTGDIIDHEECLEWLSTIGELTAKRGVYFILGNHDGKLDRAHIRRELTSNGFVDVAGRWVKLPVGEHSLLIAGDETPWGPGMPELPAPRSAEPRILLAHSPDSIDQARMAGIDLMLAGHTHGGQFCVPKFGAVVCPMQKGLELSSGTVYRSPTLLHVNRGLSGEIALRLNCRPELTKLILRSPLGMEPGDSAPLTVPAEEPALV